MTDHIETRQCGRVNLKAKINYSEMQSLIEAIPTRGEWRGMDEEQKNNLFFTLQYLLRSHGLPKVDTEYHPAEMMAIAASECPFLLDLVSELDLEIDYNA